MWIQSEKRTNPSNIVLRRFIGMLAGANGYRFFYVVYSSEYVDWLVLNSWINILSGYFKKSVRAWARTSNKLMDNASHRYYFQFVPVHLHLRIFFLRHMYTLLHCCLDHILLHAPHKIPLWKLILMLTMRAITIIKSKYKSSLWLFGNPKRHQNTPHLRHRWTNSHFTRISRIAWWK